MKCVVPDCESDMLQYQVEEITVDLCPSCKGIWFDSGELEACLKKSPRAIHTAFGKGVSLVMAREGLRGTYRKCPHCDAKMEKERYGGGVWVDRCPNGHGLWLDEGELSAIYEQNRQTATKEAPSIPEFLSVLFRPFSRK